MKISVKLSALLPLTTNSRQTLRAIATERFQPTQIDIEQVVDVRDWSVEGIRIDGKHVLVQPATPIPAEVLEMTPGSITYPVGTLVEIDVHYTGAVPASIFYEVVGVAA